MKVMGTSKQALQLVEFTSCWSAAFFIAFLVVVVVVAAALRVAASIACLVEQCPSCVDGVANSLLEALAAQQALYCMLQILCQFGCV